MIADFPYRVCKFLAGQDRPVLTGGVLLVSPAMADLIEHADEREMEHLLENLYPIRIDGLVPEEWPERLASVQ